MEAATRRPSAINPSVKRSKSSDEAVAMRRRMARGTSPVPTAAADVDCAEMPSAELYLDGHTVEEVSPSAARMKIAAIGISLSAVAALVALIAS